MTTLRRTGLLRRRAARSLGTVLFTVLLLGGCAQTHNLKYETQVDEATFPAPPNPPRFRYVGQLTGEENFERQGPGLQRVGVSALRWLVGLSSPKHEPTVLQRPQGGVVDGRGRIFVSDVSRQAVYVFDPVAGELRVWDRAQSGVPFQSPVGLALRDDGQLLVADSQLGVVARLDPQGNPQGLIGAEVLQQPTGLALDPDSGRVYVADTAADDIKVFDADGGLLHTLGGPGREPGQFNGPTFADFAHGQLYITDTLNARIQVLEPDGTPRQVFGRRGRYLGDTPRPKGVAAARDGKVYVVESFYDHLLVFDETGRFLLPIGGTGNGVGEFYLPGGVWTDNKNRIYVADTFNGRIVIFEPVEGRT